MMGFPRFLTCVSAKSRDAGNLDRVSRRRRTVRPRRSGLTVAPLEARTLMTASIIQTVAGNGMGDYTGNGGPATAAGIGTVGGVAVDSAGDIFLADSSNNMIHEVSAATGRITTIAGNRTAGYSGDGGPASRAELNDPAGLALDASGNLFIADAGNSVIRKINLSTGIITTVAGNGMAGYSGDGGPAASAELSLPLAVAVDAHGDIFIADRGNFVIREVSAATGEISTVAGDGTETEMGSYGDGGPATSAEFVPSGVAVDPAGDIFIIDDYNDLVREVSAATGVITTVAGGGPYDMPTASIYTGPATAVEFGDYQFGLNAAVDTHGNLFISDWSGEVIREVNLATGEMTTVAGTGGFSSGSNGDGGPATSAVLMGPGVVTVSPHGTVYFADDGSFLVRAFPSSSADATPWGTATGGQGTGGKGTGGATGGPGTTTIESISILKTMSAKHKMTPAIVLQFSAALNAADAQNLVDYSLATMAKSKKQKSKPVPLSQAHYDPAAHTVTLYTRKPLVMSAPLQLTVKAAKLLDSEGLTLAGGTNVVAIISKSGAKVTSAVPLARSSAL
jgi:hypothetical protein